MNAISLLYHDVVRGDAGSSGFPGAAADSYKLDETTFAAHLESIAALGSSRVQLVPPPGIFTVTLPNPIFLTFDDGGVTADEPAARLLEQRGWRGHFFIVTEKIGQPGFLTSGQIRNLHRRGHHIGSHSHTHPACFSDLSYSNMLREWRDSRDILSKIVGEAPISVSVPGGFYSADVARAASDAGYRVLFNSEPTSRIVHNQALVILGRYGIKRGTTADAAQALARGDLTPRVSQALLWNVKKPMKRVGGSVWFGFRRWFYNRKDRDVLVS